jgi:predicted naringenin-chalcone synthase
MKNRYFYHTQELLDAHPEFLDRKAPSLDARLDIAAVAAPELAAAAAAKAIAKWGRPATDITHLIVSTNSGAHAPGADHRLASLLGLRPDVCRTMLQLNGCTAGCAVLRLSKDIAENNHSARILVACVELTITSFRGPDEEDTFETLINQALFSDGAGAVIVGADPVYTAGERPLFEMVSASQTVVPGTEDVINMQLGKSGVHGNMSTKLPILAADNVEKCLVEAFGRLGVTVEWNDLFWAVHAGSKLILDNMDKILHLDPGKLASGRAVVNEYGNMLGATVIFVLSELQRQMDEEGNDAAEWGVMMGFGPGFTVETMVLHAPSNLKKN